MVAVAVVSRSSSAGGDAPGEEGAAGRGLRRREGATGRPTALSSSGWTEQLGSAELACQDETIADIDIDGIFYFAQHVLTDAARPSREWWSRRDSNPRPPRCERGALPAELLPHSGVACPIAVGRFRRRVSYPRRHGPASADLGKRRPRHAPSDNAAVHERRAPVLHFTTGVSATTAVLDRGQTRRISPVVRRVVDLMDQRFVVPGTSFRFGMDALIGMIPAVGDLLGMVIGSVVFFEAVRLRAPVRVLAQMLLNLWIDSVVGSVPVLGDAFDFVFKANRRNLKLLERHVA